MTYKGYLQKTEHGWDVLSNIQNEVIPLSPKQINYFNMHLTSTTTLYNGKEVEFEIERLYDDKYGIELIYATLVPLENELEKLATLESEVKQDDEDLEELVNQHYPVGYWTEEQCTIRRIAFRNGYREAKENYKVESSVRELHQYKIGLEDGYNKAKETLYTKQHLIDLVQSLKDYTYESHTILGHDEREASEFVETFIDIFLLKNHLKEQKTAEEEGWAQDELQYWNDL